MHFFAFLKQKKHEHFSIISNHHDYKSLIPTNQNNTGIQLLVINIWARPHLDKRAHSFASTPPFIEMRSGYTRYFGS